MARVTFPGAVAGSANACCNWHRHTGCCFSVLEKAVQHCADGAPEELLLTKSTHGVKSLKDTLQSATGGGADAAFAATAHNIASSASHAPYLDLVIDTASLFILQSSPSDYLFSFAIHNKLCRECLHRVMDAHLINLLHAGFRAPHLSVVRRKEGGESTGLR